MGWLKPLFNFLVWVVVILLAVAGIMKLFFVEVAVVGHNAMAPTMLTGERVIFWRDAKLEIGDIAVCMNPVRPGEHVVGRVVGKGGMTISAHRGRLLVAGTPIDVDYQRSLPFFDVDVARSYEVKVGVEKLGNTEHPFMERDRFELVLRAVHVRGGQVYLISDNRSYVGQDSRSFGAVDARTCVGTVFMRLAPIEDHGAGFGHRYLEIIH